jgi:hypothetical protein
MAVLKPAKEVAQVSFQLKPGEVQYLEITPAAQSATTRLVNAEDFKIWDEGMSERTKSNSKPGACPTGTRGS